MNVKMKYAALAAVVVLFTACKKEKQVSVPEVVTGNGDIAAAVSAFRNLLGTTLNTTPDAVGGRREINWDAVPDALIGQPLPNDFFNPKGNDVSLAARQRGVIYTGTNAVFMVSKTNFAEVNPLASTEFAAFSGSKNFANTDAALWDIAFEVAGKFTPATVKGFGAVFTDVDMPNSTYLEFFNNTKSLGKFYVPVQTAASKFSFLGVYFNNETVSAVKVGHDGALRSGQKDISQGGSLDLVVLDDFMYSEPVAQ